MKCSAVRFFSQPFTLLIALVALLGLTLEDGTALGAEIRIKGAFGERNPRVLDLSNHSQDEDDEEEQLKYPSGPRMFDGLPFLVRGRVYLYGKTPAARGDVHPESAKGLRVGRSFDEIHLIHHTFWPDVHGATVANFRLNYADGTSFSFPIRYGYHVRDWFNLPSYKTESVSDPQTTICWRRAPVAYKAPIRVFKSTVGNPFPEKVVDTIDVVSAKNLASYVLLAATTTDADKADGEEFVGDREFDSKVTIRVVDDETGKPIQDALIVPAMVVEGQGVVGSPIRTSIAGAGEIPYPSNETRNIWAEVEMDGYRSVSQRWTAPAPKEVTVRLKPNSSATATLSGATVLP